MIMVLLIAKQSLLQAQKLYKYSLGRVLVNVIAVGFYIPTVVMTNIERAVMKCQEYTMNMKKCFRRQ